MKSKLPITRRWPISLTIPLMLVAMVFVWGCTNKDRSQSRESAMATDDAESALARKTMPAVMQAKLAHSQALLEGIALANFRRIELNAEDLHRISMTAEWMVHESEAYFAFSERFRELAISIVGHAREQNLDAISHDYAQLTQSCIECHSWLRRERATREMPGKVTLARPSAPWLGTE